MKIWPVRISKNYGNTLLCETNTEDFIIPRVDEFLEICDEDGNEHFLKITKVEYYFNKENQSQNCVYVVGSEV